MPYGRATLTPAEPITAGAYATWTLTITVGTHGIDDGGAFAVARRDASDWEIPQFEQPTASGYVTATTTGAARLQLSYEQNCYVRPWRAALLITVADGSLAPGDRVQVVFGAGGPGMRAQTFPESAFTFLTLVDAFGTGRYYPIDPSPTLAIVGGPAEELQLVVPSRVAVDSPFSLLIRALDSWGNPAGGYTETVTLETEGVDGLPAAVQFRLGDGGILRLAGLQARRPGLLHLAATDGAGRRAQSNPLQVVPSDGQGLSLFWGDLHGQTGSTVGTGTIDEYLRYGRDVAALDFTGWQGNDFQITGESWQEITAAIHRYHVPGRFVPFLGYEWSGLTPAGGDHNFYFLGDDEPLHRSSHWLIDDWGDVESDRYPLSVALAGWGERRDALAVPHVGGRHANLDFYDPRFMPVVEIHSHHGTFEWLAMDALRRGLRVGFIAGSDDHTCRPGLSYPTREASRGLASFDVKGGLAAVYAAGLTRNELWEAIFRRHTYATTGERILLQVTTPEGAMMGDEVSGPQPPTLQVAVSGTAPLFAVEIFRGSEPLLHWPDPAAVPPDQRRLAVVWRGVRVRSRRKKARWDGSLVVQGGAFREVKPFAFDRRDEGITRLSTQAISWISTTSGDPDGLLIDIEGDSATGLRFSSAPVSFRLTLAELDKGMVTHDGGGVNLQVQLCWVPREPQAPDLTLTYQDPSPPPGTVHPYWVRVTQFDGAMAWSSPIYYRCP